MAESFIYNDVRSSLGRCEFILVKEGNIGFDARSFIIVVYDGRHAMVHRRSRSHVQLVGQTTEKSKTEPADLDLRMLDAFFVGFGVKLMLLKGWDSRNSCLGREDGNQKRF